MKIRHPFLIRLAGFLIAITVWLLTRTLRYRIYWPDDDIRADRQRGNEFFLYALWHETLLLPLYPFRGHDFRILISEHADGEMITRAAGHLGYKAIRGSTTRGATRAAREMMRSVASHDVVIFMDGPRGPRRRVKKGAVYLASRTGSRIVTAGLAFSRAWRARSWDRTAIPKPFSTAVVVVVPAMAVPPDINTREREVYRERLQRHIDAATEKAEAIARRYA